MAFRKLVLDLAYLGRRTPLRPLLRGARDQLDRVFLLLRRPPVRAQFDGLVLSGFLRHRDFIRNAADGYEDASRRLFIDALEAGVTVIDGGAHIGVFALSAAARIGQGGQVFAIEADPYNYAALRINKQRNGLENLEAIHAALDESSGERMFHVSRGTIASSLVNKSYITDTRTLRVPATTIDATLASVDLTRLVIKLDVEGAEDRVLRGGSESLAAAKSCRIILEHNAQALHDAGVSSDAVLVLLTNLGFVVSILDEQTGETTPATPPALENLKANLIADKSLG
jgi:FkbM family methyltransferase